MKLKKLTHINSSYTLNDYLLPRGANLYVSGVGTKIRKMMTNGSTNKSKYKGVIDWLNGRCRAFGSHANAKSKLVVLMEGRNHRDLPWNHVWPLRPQVWTV